MDSIRTDPRYSGYQGDFEYPKLASFEEYYLWWASRSSNTISRKDCEHSWNRYVHEEMEKYGRDIKLRDEGYKGWGYIGEQSPGYLFRHYCMKSGPILKKSKDMSLLRQKDCYYCFNSAGSNGLSRKTKNKQKERRFIHWLHSECDPLTKLKKEKK